MLVDKIGRTVVVAYEDWSGSETLERDMIDECHRICSSCIVDESEDTDIASPDWEIVGYSPLSGSRSCELVIRSINWYCVCSSSIITIGTTRRC